MRSRARVPDPREVARTALRPTIVLPFLIVGFLTFFLVRALFEASAKPAPDVVVRDRFDRSVAEGWGPASYGGSFVLSGTKSDYTVTAGAGVMAVPGAGVARRALVQDALVRDADLSFRVGLESPPTGGGSFVYGVLRQNAGVGEYRAKIRFAPTGAVYIGMTAIEGDRERPLGEEFRVPELSYSIGSMLNIRCRIEGAEPATIRLKVWSTDQPEPVGWNLRADDNGIGLDQPGSLGVQGYASRTTSTFPVRFLFDDLEARSLPDSAAGPASPAASERPSPS